MARTSVAFVGLVAAYSVGGPNLVLLLSSAALVAQVVARKGLDPLTSLLSGLALAISWVFIVGALVVPCLKLLPGADVALFQTTKLRGTSVAGEFSTTHSRKPSELCRCSSRHYRFSSCCGGKSGSGVLAVAY